jgi:hypothetical protein
MLHLAKAPNWDKKLMGAEAHDFIIHRKESIKGGKEKTNKLLPGRQRK